MRTIASAEDGKTWRNIGPLNRTDIGVYPSATRRNSEFVLWDPDRKCFLLGKTISGDWLADLTVPTE